MSISIFTIVHHRTMGRNSFTWYTGTVMETLCNHTLLSIIVHIWLKMLMKKCLSYPYMERQ